MGHNLTDRKLRELSEKAASEGLTGWARTDGRLEAVQTVAGCIARGAVVRGRCAKHPDCSRRVTVDLVFWADHGFRGMLWTGLVKHYACGRLGGCGLDFQSEHPEGVPLVLLAEPPDHNVAFFCQACRVCGYSSPASKLLAGLRRRNHPLAETAGVMTVARLLRLSCRCQPHRQALWYARAEPMQAAAAPRV